MIQPDRTRTPADLVPGINRLFEISAAKIRSLEKSWSPSNGAPVFTVEGRYTARGWTEWTEGFQYGSALLQFDATSQREFLDLGRERTLTRMAPHLIKALQDERVQVRVSAAVSLGKIGDASAVEALETALRVSEVNRRNERGLIDEAD